MDRKATKTPGQREDEQVERLVRPSPKLKPPRRDLRRETVEPDKDPDSKPDKDLSKNFKDIGGSVAARVLARWAAGPPPKKPLTAIKPVKPGGARKILTQPKKKPGGAKPAPGAGQEVKVRSKANGKVFMIKKETLEADPGAYEIVKPGDEEAAPPEGKPEAPANPPEPPKEGKPAPKPEPEPQAKPKPADKSGPEKPTTGEGGDQLETDRASLEQLSAMEAQDPTLKIILNDFRKPGSDSGTIARENPKYPVAVFLRGRKVPESIKTVGDLIRVLELPLNHPPAEIKKQPGKKKPKQKQPEAQPQPGQPQPEQPAQPQPEQPQEKAAPAAAPEPVEEAGAGDKADRALQKQLRLMGIEDAAVGQLFNALKDPSSDEAELARDLPSVPLKSLMQGKELPEGVKTLGDLSRILNLPAAKKGPAQSAPPAVQPQGPGVPQKPDPAAPVGFKPPPAEDPKDRALRNEMRSLIKSSPELDQALSHKETKAQLKQDIKAHPDFAVADYFKGLQGVKFPEGIKTLKDLERVMALPGKDPAEKKPVPGDKPEKLQKPVEDKEDRVRRDEMQKLLKLNRGFSDALKDSDIREKLKKAIKEHPEYSATEHLEPILNGSKLPKGIETLGDFERVMRLPEKSPTSSSSKPELSKATYQSGQPERAVSSSERERATHLVASTFPVDVAADILSASPPYHPDEISELIRDFHVARSLPSKDLGDLMSKAANFYATDPSKVRPPKENLDDLSEVERAKAIRKHQVQTVAMSLGVKAAVSKEYERKGTPPDLAGKLSEFILSGAQQSPSERGKRAEALATQIFTENLGKPRSEKKPEPLSDGAVKRLMKASNDPAVRKLIVGYCQARDYQEARLQFLDPQSDEAISERHAPKAIAAKLSRAAKFLRERAERYPDSTPNDASSTFRNRVMKHLARLDRDKALEVQSLLDVDDNKHYEKQLKKHKKAEAEYAKKRAEVETHYERDFSAYSEKLKNGGDPDGDPPPNVDDRLVEASIERPIPPPKPVNYDKLTKTPEELGEDSQKLWQQFRNKFASDSGLIQRVAARGSFYSDTCAMDRTAVYWGVDPYPRGKEGPEAYQGWEQPHARDLGEPELSKILKAAKTWLKQPVLSENIEGVVRDTQLRAALDLALRAENYEQAVHPAVYNKLLARLAGVSEDETLLTVRSKTARNPMSKKVELETARADRLLAGLDRIASVVQSNHKQWGMDFTAAKNLVNAIDKIADDLEMSTYGEKSLLNRQAQEIGQAKLAQVIQKDSDEKYIDTFKNPMSPHQTEADEPYMKQYRDDQSSAVRNGKTLSGRKLAP
jgi:hypothetical protein